MTSLEFTRNLQAMHNNVIGAFTKPLPSTDPLSAYRYNEARSRTLQDGFRQRPLVRMQDKNLQQMARIGAEISTTFEEIAADTGEAQVVIRGGDYLADFVRNAVRVEEDLHLSIDPNPSRPSWKTRWGGKITTINVKRDSSGIHTVELIASSQREHLKHVLVGTTPFFPPEVQPLRMWLLPANCRTACATTLFINLARQFEPGLSFVTNIFNPFGWINPFGPDALLNVSPLQWPIQVQFVNPLLDQSRTTVLTGMWNDFHTAAGDVMKDAGVCARAYTYFTEDDDNPQPELAELLPKIRLRNIPIVGRLVDAVDAYLTRTGLADIPENATLADLARPQRNCVMVAFEDHSGYSGPTGTALDGVLNLFSSTLDDLITTTVFPVDLNDDGEVDPVFRKLFLVAPKPPWAVYRDGQHSGIIESNYTQHKGPVKTVMTGSKSPKIVNDLQTFGIKFGLSQIQTVIVAGQFGSVGPAPVGAGLDELYQGQLDNCVSRDTIIEGPQGDTRIDVLAARGEPFQVWSITPAGESVPAWATLAFKKGVAELFEYTLSDGRAIKATRQHKFLTTCGFVAGEHIGVGSKIAASDHRRFQTSRPWNVTDAMYENMGETDALRFREVVNVRSVGVDEFYDMHVPGWENYSANGIWNHNTLLAWQRYTDPLRALYTGDLGWLEQFEHPGGSAYTISAILALRQANWKTRAYRSFRTSIRQSAPYIIGSDILLDDRVGFEQDGITYVDQMTAIKFEYDRKKPVTYTVSIGNDSKDEDPFAQGIRALQGLYTVIAAVIAGDDIFN